ncbi:hypothetical protein NDU88_006444 [Pleurodeles waltl]|uniref:Uncharacterized protein n=1 Tax=Pleurodeles waltl TaxID=8319 RepID=A0AAV7TF49_PLEWA|nr:hypothetical protein NDU88_006444 [Pleurodeles waltl]
MCSGDPTGGMHSAKNLEVEARKIGRRKKVPDWSKDSRDKFYSLTEDSEATGCNQSATDGSISSEFGVHHQHRNPLCDNNDGNVDVQKHGLVLLGESSS